VCFCWAQCGCARRGRCFGVHARKRELAPIPEHMHAREGERAHAFNKWCATEGGTTRCRLAPWSEVHLGGAYKARTSTSVPRMCLPSGMHMPDAPVCTPQTCTPHPHRKLFGLCTLCASQPVPAACRPTLLTWEARVGDTASAHCRSPAPPQAPCVHLTPQL